MTSTMSSRCISSRLLTIMSTDRGVLPDDMIQSVTIARLGLRSSLNFSNLAFVYPTGDDWCEHRATRVHPGRAGVRSGPMRVHIGPIRVHSGPARVHPGPTRVHIGPIRVHSRTARVHSLSRKVIQGQGVFILG